MTVDRGRRRLAKNPDLAVVSKLCREFGLDFDIVMPRGRGHPKAEITVERLRLQVSPIEFRGHNESLMDEAADEIARLRAQLDKAREALRAISQGSDIQKEP